VSGNTLSSRVERVRTRAADLAAGFSVNARRSATIAQERAVLRMLGVDGLDRAGRPLAATLAERYCGSDAGRLARGVLLPFVVAMLEYDLGPHELALDGASGGIDLGLEAALLERPDRLAAAEQRAAQLLHAAMARFDANRTAARDMREVLGLSVEPWLGAGLQSTEVGAAAVEAKALIRGGAGLLQIRVPASWEFAEARRQAGLETPGLFEAMPGGLDSHRATRGTVGRASKKPAQPPPIAEPVPAGSQRGLATLRRVADEAGAERRCYAALMTVTSAFAAPEQAVVAAFERIDFVGADPIREIVEDSVDPERAIADHSFAHRLQARAGCRVVIGAGPLALGADLASGIPSGAATRAGRALALQALGVELALADGLAPDRLMLGVVPDWVVGEVGPSAILLQAWLRHSLFPDQRLVLDGATGWLSSRSGFAAAVSALSGADVSLVVEPDLTGDSSVEAEDLAAAARAARAMRTTLGDGALHGDAGDLAGLTLEAAESALQSLAAEGWDSMLGPARRGADDERLGRAAVVDRETGPMSSERLLRDLV
jgi:hypothetical protein